MANPSPLSPRDRFATKVGAPNSQGCTEWQAGTQGHYGTFWLNGANIGAHRAAWLFAHGQIPDGLMVCHRCDNPLCVTAEHLFLGTGGDNVADRHAKGRDSIGMRQPMSKLIDSQVRAVLAAPPETPHAELAAALPVGRATIWRIRKRRNWKHLAAA